MYVRHWTAALVISATLLGAGCAGGPFHHKDCCATPPPPCGCKTTAAAPPCGCNATAALPAGAIPVQPGLGQPYGQ